MHLDQVALEMAKVLLPQMGEGYRTYEELMGDAFTAARCFLGTARQQPVESPENSPAPPVQHAQPSISQLIGKWYDIEKPPLCICRALNRFAEWAEKQQAGAQ